MTNGRVATGFSSPIVARYVNTNGVISYTGAMPLARGVEVSVEPEISDGNDFYADNVIAESEPGTLIGGTVTLTVDGLLLDAEQFIFGLSEGTADWTDYNDNMEIPYVGVGYVARYMSGGVTSYVPYIFTKVRFNIAGHEFATQEDSIEWQTQELEAAIYRDDSAVHTWRKVGAAVATEADAIAAINTFFGQE